MSGRDLASFYARRRVLVTGHTGFKGSWLVGWLTRLGADVSGFALAPDTDPSLFELSGLAHGMKSIIGDVRDRDALGRVFSAHPPEIVFHLAAQALVLRSYREPVETYATNVLGTVHLLELCRQTSSVRACVIVTSDKCYENLDADGMAPRAHGPYRESDPLGGHDPYSSSKACAEIVTSAYRRSFFDEGAAIASARAGNVIGGGDWSENRLLPDIVRGASRGHATLIRNPSFTRPWQHVLEPLHGYLMLAARLAENPGAFATDRGAPDALAFNFGPPAEDAVAVGRVAQRFVELLGSGSLELAKPGPNAGTGHEARSLELDASKARALLGWQPRLSLEGAIELTAEWYRRFLAEPASARALLDGQVAHYESLSPSTRGPR